MSALTDHQLVYLIGHLLGCTFYAAPSENGWQLKCEYLEFDARGNMLATPRASKTHPITKQLPNLPNSMTKLARARSDGMLDWLVSNGRTRKGLGPIPMPADGETSLAQQLIRSTK